MDEQESPDYHNFTQTQTQTHRLPTVNGAQILFDVPEANKLISTGLLELDNTLASSLSVLEASGGITRGRLTEIYGPPGAGKTHLGMQLVANALNEDGEACAVWIDTSSDLCRDRLKCFVSRCCMPANGAEGTKSTAVAGNEVDTLPERFSHFYISSFPHLLSVIASPDSDLIPEKTSVMIIDDLSDIVLTGLPQNLKFNEPTLNGLSREEVVAKSIASRRSVLISALSSSLARLAAARNIAVVVLNKTSSHRKAGIRGPILRPALNVPQWNENVATRLAICRDFWPETDWAALDPSERRRQRWREKWPLRVIGVEKVDGREKRIEWIRYVILKDHLRAIGGQESAIQSVTAALPSSPPVHDEDDNEEAMGNLGIGDVVETIDLSTQLPEHPPPSSAPSRKRAIAEVADSEDDEEEVSAIRRNNRPSIQSPGHPPIGGFIASSQLLQEETEASRDVGKEQDSGLEDEMLPK